MPETAQTDARSNDGKTGRTSGWYVLLLAWLAFAGLYFAFSKTMVEPAADITNYRILEIANTYGHFVGAAIGLVTFLVTGLVYLVARAFAKGARRAVACVITLLAYGLWVWHGYDLLYVEPRYAEVARAIITYTGKPTLYAAAAVCALSLLTLIISLIARASKRRAS